MLGSSNVPVTTNLGVLPHQVRGSVFSFQNVMLKGYAFDKCTACSQTVLEAYRHDGFPFILNALNRPSYLEDITRLTQLKAEAEAMAAQLEAEMSLDFDDNTGDDF
eukprot:TRINITY_DN13501_c0_g1_i3.p1 TRINITY_DN13501_c0_g1~~TRINITY_DN13501_c0_g1_i3.p1  ORF type:complete len:106 (-),score=26.92 TRINITY_DN13501_c0_g1_i3:27-344(-)